MFKVQRFGFGGRRCSPLNAALDIKGGVDKKDLQIHQLKSESEVLRSENENLRKEISRLKGLENTEE
ncbi:hypothetical protein [Vibrio parahaemolyticus]|uniref:hypothetical protein n=1 Tax=Vibrio parahaemolyticus TaxID=670 RepID=UPI00038E23AB|nr:hypothetical protein [Vibrio parahaemolyticus]ANQ55777.1 hypothetical protein AB831_06160 [Vibrio parahaemolyticus]ASO15625.1 hypothetical protein BGM07_015205 [Vibrio parahaemolyticus]EGQ7714783.1 hypothetical protein [Vibrio parahaemolyticus]EGQ7720826.1 hypothetical protein [Vibrio parahaemolyticus]EGQ7723841.1 hypothetical protein [Vibrio parahaemolyticus]